MRFLVTSHSRVPSSPSPDMANVLIKMNRATKNWIKEEKKAGRLVDVWAKTDMSGCFWLWEVDSNESLFKKLTENPASLFVDYTVDPLTDMDEALDTLYQLTTRMIKE